MKVCKLEVCDVKLGDMKSLYYEVCKLEVCDVKLGDMKSLCYESL